MKKIIALLLCALTLALALAGCAPGFRKRDEIGIVEVPTGITYTLYLSQFPLESALART